MDLSSKWYNRVEQSFSVAEFACCGGTTDGRLAAAAALSEAAAALAIRFPLVAFSIALTRSENPLFFIVLR